MLGGCTAGINLCGADSDCTSPATCDTEHGVCVLPPGTVVVGGGNDTGGGNGQGGGTPGGGMGGGDPGGGPGRLEILVAAPPRQTAVPGATVDDMPAGHRRNQPLFAWLKADAAFRAPSVTFTGSRSVTANAVAADASNCTAPCDGTCACYRIEPWRVPLDGLRGSFTVSASDGSTAAKAVSVPVTRFLWRRAIDGEVTAAPALSPDGTLYVGSKSRGGMMRRGAVWAITPAGAERWEEDELGEVTTSPVLSAPDRLYVGSTEGNGARMSMLNPQSGDSLGDCTRGSSGSSIVLSPALSGSGAVFHLAGSNELMQVAPGACGSAEKAVDVSTVGGVVARGTTLYLGNGSWVRRFDYDGSKWQERNQGQWPLGVVGFQARSLALAQPDKLFIAGGAVGGSTVLRANVGNNVSLDGSLYPLKLLGRSNNPQVVSSDGLAVLGTNGGLATVSDAEGRIFDSGDTVVAPVMGEGGRVYSLAGDTLIEWTRAGATAMASVSFKLDGMSAMGGFSAAPVLDCAREPNGAARPGVPGTLYVVTRGGQLTALTVESRGIDTAAPWPTQLHDPANTGNRDTALTPYACP